MPFEPRWPRRPERRPIAWRCTPLHQHDAPGCDFTAERLIRELGLKDYGRFEGTFHRQVIRRMADAVREALPRAQPVTHYGWGVAEVREVASNRRIKGPDGKVRATHYTTTKDPTLRAEPVGVIDPQVSLLSFWNEKIPLAVLSYYACHPQSYYRTGVPSPDFPGIARFIRGQTCPMRCTCTSTARGATSAPANTTTATRRTACCWPGGWPTA